jgi:5-methyltetrahydropteroyltriglutamate--homocysteine methyltransferase
MTIAINLGFPRIGLKRELKKAMEGYWEGNLSEQELLQVGSDIRRRNWQLHHQVGIQHVPCNDFSFYDHMLDTSFMLGAIPNRFRDLSNQTNLDLYFAMARGSKRGIFKDTKPLEMTKWFNSNYHYIVPEISPNSQFALLSTKPLDDFLEAKSIGIHTRPVIIGPMTFLLLSKSTSSDFSPIEKIDELIPIYLELLQKLAKEGTEWVQMDEPCLVLDQPDRIIHLYQRVYQRIGESFPHPKILLTTYYDAVTCPIQKITELPIDAIHLDLIQGKYDIEAIPAYLQNHQILSLGIIDGRNVWRSDLKKAFNLANQLVKKIGKERIFIAPSSSLLHVPQDVEQEIKLDPEVKSWLAFGKQKLEEIVVITQMIHGETHKSAPLLEMNQKALNSRRKSTIVNMPNIIHRFNQVDKRMLRRKSSFNKRSRIQKDRLNLPLFPTTTIGSFPQTDMIRSMRNRRLKGLITKHEYEAFIEDEVIKAINFQEEIGLDVLVHGEFERNDMVQYFAEQLKGFTFTENGWVQSFGSRYVRPPILYGDVYRPAPMSTKWIQFAQQHTNRPLKGMLTGPVTMLNWSFVRDDQPRSTTCLQIALAVRDEVADLEAAGISIIQIDEPAFREGLPLHRKDWHAYMKWMIKCFQLASAGVQDETQIHTHMCYSEFNEIILEIAALDADVISIEAARSKMELLNAFSQYNYPNDIGPGVYDIHSPRIPTADEMQELLMRALKDIPANQIWVNPDCGLKTRKWDEIKPALKNMVSAAKKMRQIKLT